MDEQSHILAARTVANILRTSLGPRGIRPSFHLGPANSFLYRLGQNLDISRRRDHSY